jgi:signal transduction histidine kinase
MTIRTRLTLWYTTVLFALIVVLGLALFYEFKIEPDRDRARGRKEEPLGHEIAEVLFFYALPAALLTVAGGWWLTRKALAPMAEITRAAASLQPPALSGAELPRTGNGDELDRLAAVFNSMLQRVAASFVREREFTLHASHELKTPLAVMRAQIETALREKQLTADQRELLGAHLEEIVRCASIVDSLAFLARADAGLLTLQLQSIRLDDLVKEAFEDLQTLGAEKHLAARLESCDPIVVTADPHRLRQVLLNLCDNAVKHNTTGGSVALALTLRGSSAELVIRNTGESLSPEQVSRVFDRFYRGDPAHNPNSDGSGLGLSIVRSIVRAHDGTAVFTSEAGWNTIVVRLPGAARPPLKESETNAATSLARATG